MATDMASRRTRIAARPLVDLGTEVAASTNVNNEVARSALDRSRVIYGETRGLYPQSIDPKKSPYDPINWQTDSIEALQAARKYIGIVAGRNGVTQSTDPNLANPLERRAWESAVSAGNAAHVDPDLIDSHITHFFLRGGEDTRQPWPELHRYLTIGPFRNVGGGDVPRGNDVYIEFYGTK